MRRFVLVVTLIIVTLGMLGVAFRVHRVEAGGTIYIRADGSVEPSTAQIYQDGDVYAFTDNIYDEIVVERSNVVIDGNGNVLEGNGSGHGFSVHGINNVTIRNVVVKDFAVGAYLNSSSGNVISGNIIMWNTEHGVYLDGSSNNRIFGNDLENNFKGIELWDSCENSVSGNNITAEAVYNDYGIKLRYCSNNTISGNNIRNNDEGVYLANSSSSTISANSIEDNYYGIALANSSSNIIFGNVLRNNDEGTRLRFSSSNIISGNNMTATNNNGVWFFHSSNNTVCGNSIAANRLYGVWLSWSSNNTFSGNNIRDNGEKGILVLGRVVGNKFYHNNFVNNTQQVYIQGSECANFWDDGYPYGGNYWSDYHGVDSDYDGIGESWYEIDQNNTDHHPLMGMFHSFNTSLVSYVNIISNSTIESFEYFEVNSTIRMHVSNSSVGQVFGFCRVRIPHVLMSGSYTVTIDGVNPIYWNYTLYDDGENGWIYFAYEHSTLEIVIVPEFPSLTIMILFMVATLSAVMVYTRKLLRRIDEKHRV